MGEKRHGLEKFVPPKPLYVESDTTGDARPPVVEYLARHYRSQYDLEKRKVYDNHAMHTCYNLPLEDVTEHFETPCVSEVVSSLKSGGQSAVSKTIHISQKSNESTLNSTLNIPTLKSGDLISYKGISQNTKPLYLSFTVPSDVSSFYFVATGTNLVFLKTDSLNSPISVQNNILYNLVNVGGKLYSFESQ